MYHKRGRFLLDLRGGDSAWVKFGKDTRSTNFGMDVKAAVGLANKFIPPVQKDLENAARDES